MDNFLESKIPYSAEAVKELFGLERAHLWVINPERQYRSGWCVYCFPDTRFVEAIKDGFVSQCLIEARESASKETLIAVALLLSGDANG